MSKTKDREQLKKIAMKHIEALGIPFSVQYISNTMGVSWGYARSILLELALEGKVKAIKTTRGYVFKKMEMKK